MDWWTGGLRSGYIKPRTGYKTRTELKILLKRTKYQFYFGKNGTSSVLSSVLDLRVFVKKLEERSVFYIIPRKNTTSANQ